MSPIDAATGIPMDVAILIETELGQSLLCSGSYYGRERIFDVLIVTDRDSYHLDVFSSTLKTSGVPSSIASEQENCWRVTLDFVAAVADGHEPLVPGAAVLPAMRALELVQVDWNRIHGRQSLPGRPMA
jgi:2-hydroxy-4-carboxymuconate semialdehyde hemiacetal dehydrogenase